MKPAGTRAWLAIGLAVALAYVLGQGLGLFVRVDALLQDRFFRWRTPHADLPISIVELDTRTLNALGWPLSRAHHANLLLYLARHGARIVGYDVLLSESGDELEDAALAMAASELPVCMSFSLAVADEPVTARIDEADSVVAACGYPVPRDIGLREAFELGDTPYEALREAAAAMGHASLIPCGDGVVRSVPLFLVFGRHAYPAFSFALFALWSGLPRDSVGLSAGEAHIMVGTRRSDVPLVRGGEMVIDWDPGMQDRVPAYSMWEILLDDRREAEGMSSRLGQQFRDRAIIVGVTAEALHDSPPTPLGPKTPGCMIHAQALATLMRGTFLHPLSTAQLAVAAFLLLPFVGWCSGRFGSGRAGLASAGVVVATGLAAWLLFAGRGIVTPALSLMMAEAVAYAGASGYERYRKEKEGRQVKTMFGKYVAPAVLEELLERPDQVLSLQGTKRELSVVFCDVKGFSALCEELDPPGLLQQLNEYLDEMTDVIFGLEGTVDKFMGDAVMAFFGHPLRTPDHPERAVRAGLQMQSRMAALRKRWSTEGRPLLHIRVGVHTGPALVGNMGSRRRLDYTVFGPTVNLAQRLEVSCEPDGVLVSEETFRRAREVATMVQEKSVEAKNIGTVRAYQVAPAEES
jgi:adenylate cyclase